MISRCIALTGVLIFINTLALAQTPSDVDRVIHNFNARVASAYEAGDRYSILSKASTIAREAFHYLKRTLPKVHGSLAYNYEHSVGIRIVTSADRKFRLWMFDESEGSSGTFETLLEYQTSSGSKVLDISDRTPRSAISGGWSDTIYSITSSTGKTSYLPIMHYAADSRTAATGVKAYTIDGDRLERNVKLFKTPKRELSSISYFYDFFKSEGLSEIRLVDNKLLIPLVEEDSVTSGNLRYEFDGKQFVYKGIEK
jgi:hypothetical protein